MKCIAAIWEDMYVGMPLKDTDDRTIERLLDTIRNITGESELKIQNSCGLFPQLKLSLTHGTWYLERAQEGYYILPEYRAGRRFLTRLDASVAADLILTFDSYIPVIVARAKNELQRRKEAMMLTDGYAPEPTIPEGFKTCLLWVCENQLCLDHHKSWMEKCGRTCVMQLG